MKKLLLLPLLFVGLEASARTWNLDDCIEYAIEHNINVKQQNLSSMQGDLEVTDAKDAFLPRLSGYASESFSFGRGLTADNTYANRNTNAFSVGASLNVPLFQGLSAVRRLAYSRSNLKALLEQTEAAKDDVTLNVISQYLQALYASEILKVARINLEISRNELERRRALLESGKIPELDIYQAEAAVSNDELSVTQAANDSVMAVLELSQLLNLPDAEDFEILPLEDDKPFIEEPEAVFANAWVNNHAVRAERFRGEAAEKNVLVAKSAYIPTLSFSAGLGTNYYKTSGFQNEGFGQQMRHNFAQQLGFSLSVPIFDAFSARNGVKRARLQQENARLQLENTRNNLYKSIMQAYTQAVGAAKKQESSEKAVESARAAFDAIQVKFNNGRANNTEFEKAKSDYTSALVQEVQARYERVLRARILSFYNR